MVVHMYLNGLIVCDSSLKMDGPDTHISDEEILEKRKSYQ